MRPLYLANHSQPARHHYVFAYFVRIENVGKRTVQLNARRWQIHDSIGEDYEVSGEGVVGEQPILMPGQIHEYQSFCVLKSASGFMEGAYLFQSEDGEPFEAVIPRFYLDASEANEAS